MSEWMDKPDCDGWWWRWRPGDDHGEIVSVVGDQVFPAGCDGSYSVMKDFNASKWMTVPTPISPPRQLPKSREVTLTARIQKERDNG